MVERRMLSCRVVLSLLALAVVALGTSACTSSDTSQDPSEQVGDADGGAEAPGSRTGVPVTETFARVPEELPAALVPENARDVMGRVAGGDGGWSASVRYLIDADREGFAGRVDGLVADAGFALQRRSIEAERTVAIYESADGAILTVTLLDEGDGTLRATGIIVGP